MSFSMSPRSRWLHCVICLFVLAIGLPSGCSQDIKPADFSGRTPIIRVSILQNQTGVVLVSSAPPSVRMMADMATRRVDVPSSMPIALTNTPMGWRLGGVSLGKGELVLLPASEGSVTVNGHAYRGRYRFVSKANGQFDVINDVDVEGYLKGVLARELFANFADETYKAQAVVARTYAIYEKQTRPTNTEFDIFSDDRDQVYGGISAETTKARAAVEDTHGIVLAYGRDGQERIFKTYFSSCCGGAGQSAAEAFGDPVFPPLAAQKNGTVCKESPKFSWPTVTISKTDLTHRLQHFGQTHNMPEKDIAPITRIDILSINNVGRPVLFTITDAKRRRYSLTGEEIRRAINTDSTPTTKLPSSFFQLDNQPNDIRFINGHGLGHGVGMCQWCAQARAETGTNYRMIVLLAYPQSKLITAY